MAIVGPKTPHFVGSSASSEALWMSASCIVALTIPKRYWTRVADLRQGYLSER